MGLLLEAGGADRWRNRVNPARAELADLLEQDASRVGQVYRLPRRVPPRNEIASELGVGINIFVSKTASSPK